MALKKQNRRNDAIEWFGILAGPVAWLTQFLINYALVREACIGHSKLILHVVSLIFLALVLGAGIVSAKYFFQTRRQSAAGEETSARPYFMATLGLFSSALFALAIIGQAIAQFILDPCQK